MYITNNYAYIDCSHVRNENLWNIWQRQSRKSREQDCQKKLGNVSPGTQTSDLSILPRTTRQLLGSIATLLLYNPGVANRFMAVAAAKLLQSCPTLCDPIDSSPPGSPVPGVLQARTLEWVAISFSNAWKWKVKVKSLSSVRLFDPMGSSIHGILQARVLEWGDIAFSEGSWVAIILNLFGHWNFPVACRIILCSYKEEDKEN